MTSPNVVRKEASEKASNIRDRAVESLAGGRAQIQHISHHQKDGIGPNARAVLDGYVATLTKIVEDLSGLDLAV